MSEAIDELKYELKSKIRSLNDYSWNKTLEWEDVERWLENFNDANEKIQMLYLLSQFIFIGGREIKELIKHLYRDKFKYNLIKNIRINNNHTTDSKEINKKFTDHLEKTRFLGVGNPSESGTHLLYYFRQENSLPKSAFINSHEITKRNGANIEIREPSIEHYVFIDDLCGSGDQACTYSDDLISEIKSLNPNAKTSYYVVFGMSGGLNKVRNESLFDDVVCAYELDNSFKSFSDESRFYKNSPEIINKAEGKLICEKYGRRLWPGSELGYESCQLLLGLLHNTPDNTLPVIWSTEDNWTPIFKRHHKIYDWGV